MSSAESAPGRRADRAGVAVLAALAALALGPVLLQRGVVLVGDMTFVPQRPWKAEWLGLDGSVPRAVPADAVVSVLTHVVPGDLLQKAVLLAILFLAGLGTLRLLGALASGPGRFSALAGAVFYLWNPYVQERLAIGHWGLLLGYAALPWVALRADGVRRRAAGSWPALIGWLGVAAIGSPTGGILAGVLALALGVERRRAVPGLLRITVVVAVLNGPWILAGAVATGMGRDPAGVTAFAARSDSPYGVLGSVATFGGIWKQSIVAGERGSWLLVGVAALATIAGILALTRTAPRLVVVGLLGFALALVPATSAGASLVEHLVEHVPGAGLLRDSQKWVALLALAACVGFALAVDHAVRGAVRQGLPGRAVAGAAVLLPVALLPSLAWGLAGQYRPVVIPQDWTRAAQVLAAVPADQLRTVVLPFSAYQRFGWNAERAALDPAIRFFPGQVVTDDRLVVGGVTVDGDSDAAASIGTAVADGAPLAPVLAGQGIRFVLVEKTAAGAADLRAPTGRVVYDGPEIRLIDLGTPARLRHGREVPLLIGADVVAALLFLAGPTFLAVRRFRHKSARIG
jgi:hypothetical protein